MIPFVDFLPMLTTGVILVNDVVTTNVDSEIILDRFEEVEHDGSIHAERVTRVISYGIAAMVDREWLAEHAPPGKS
jgi:hypothetical protein